jgi:DNA-directed RNA polymerase specialized sigma24 family protein
LERQQAVSELLNGEAHTQQETAEILGVSQRTVSDDLAKVLKDGGYIRLSIEERREAVQNLTDDGFTQRETAGVIGVSVVTVNADVQNLNKRQGRI